MYDTKQRMAEVRRLLKLVRKCQAETSRIEQQRCLREINASLYAELQILKNDLTNGEKGGFYEAIS